MLYYCSACRGGYASAGEAPPDECPLCEQRATWWPFLVTVNDRRFLRSLRIAVADPVVRTEAIE